MLASVLVGLPVSILLFNRPINQHVSQLTERRVKKRSLRRRADTLQVHSLRDLQLA